MFGCALRTFRRLPFNLTMSFVWQEIKAFCDCRLLGPPGYWRSKSRFEVDFVVVSLEPAPRRVDGIDILPWREFLTRLWGGVWPIS